MNLPRHKLTVVVYLSILPLVWFLLPLMRQALASLPGWISVLVTTAVLVLLMIYVAMPLTMRVLRFWQMPSSRADQETSSTP